MAIFLDDGLGGGASKMKTKINSLTVHADLLKFGFVINEEKSIWEPVQIITWLGTVLDTNQGFISVTEQRISKLKVNIDSVLKGDSMIVNMRSLATFEGQIISLTPCVGGVARIMTTSLYAVVNTKVSWNSTVVLTKEACSELVFWSQNVDSLNCRCPWLPLCQPAKLVYSDASDYACGSFIHSEGKIFQQNWSPERNNSSTWRELKAVELALISFAPSLLGKQVAWFTDNTNVVSIVHSGSKVTELQDLALRIFHVCVSFGISLEMKWIPRDLNSFAYHLSRMTTQLMMMFSKFWMFDGDRIPLTDLHVAIMLGFPALILDFTSQVLRLSTVFYKTGSLRTIGYFLQFPKLRELVNHLRLCNAEGTLVIPMWKSSYFWVLLCNDGRHWNPFVHDWVVLPKFKQLFVRGKAKNDMFGARELSFAVVALRINFKLPERRNQAGFCTHGSGFFFICCNG